MEEVDYPKDYENLQTKPVLDPFKSTAPHRKVRELPRKMKIEEVEEPETMKIYRQNPFTPVWATRELWKFTHETNMQARNQENSDEICAQPVRHLDLATPAFYTYRKNPKCYHTVWGTTWNDRKSRNNIFSKQQPKTKQHPTLILVPFRGTVINCRIDFDPTGTSSKDLSAEALLLDGEKCCQDPGFCWKRCP